MKNLNPSWSRASITLAVGAMLFLPGVSRAITTTFNVNSSLSSLTLEVSISGQPLVIDPTSSLVDFWGGTITADVTDGIITFTGGSAITALENLNAPFAPPKGDPFLEEGVDNYGMYASSGFYTLVGAWRDLTLDITAGTAQDSLTPSAMQVNYLSGSRLDGLITSPINQPFFENLSNDGAVDNTTPGTVDWDGTTLILPMQFTMYGDDGLIQVWEGNIVASVVPVPEPSSLMLVLLGLGWLAVRRARSSPVQKS